MTAANPPSPPPQQSKNVFRLHGVNVLNRKNVDSIARLTALERRRATHILDERQRRDTMNQLLTELSSLVQESAADAAASAIAPQPSPSPSPAPTTIPSLNTDGTEKKPARPPVKSNSITTLRNAIAEIRRLRACAGLQAISCGSDGDDSCSTHSGNHLASSATKPRRSPSHSQRSSCSRSTSPVSYPEHTSPLSTLAALATRHRDGLDSHSGESQSPSPMSSPRLQEAYSVRGAEGCFSRDPTSRNQLHSPPLSPSSPLTMSSQYHFLGGVAAVGAFPVMGSPLASVVSPMSSMTFHPQEEKEQEEYQSPSRAEYASGFGQFEYRPGPPWGGGSSSP